MGWLARKSSAGSYAASTTVGCGRSRAEEGLAVLRAVGEVEVAAVDRPRPERCLERRDARLDEAPRLLVAGNAGSEEGEAGVDRPDRAVLLEGSTTAPPSWRTSTQRSGEPEHGPATATSAFRVSGVTSARLKPSPAAGTGWAGPSGGGEGLRPGSSRTCPSPGRAHGAAEAGQRRPPRCRCRRPRR